MPNPPGSGGDLWKKWRRNLNKKSPVLPGFLIELYFAMSTNLISKVKS